MRISRRDVLGEMPLVVTAAALSGRAFAQNADADYVETIPGGSTDANVPPKTRIPRDRTIVKSLLSLGKDSPIALCRAHYEGAEILGISSALILFTREAVSPERDEHVSRLLHRRP
jgi:hypothetical protein